MEVVADQVGWQRKVRLDMDEDLVGSPFSGGSHANECRVECWEPKICEERQYLRNMSPG